MGRKQADTASVLSKIIADLEGLSADQQQNLLDTVSTFFGLGGRERRSQTTSQSRADSTVVRPAGGGFAESRDMTPKQFVTQKQPRTDVERVACLAFYLTHYRNTPHFKTIDISKLNTEAAQSKMSNPAMAVDNAGKTGYLVPASKGAKQLSAPGEAFVQVLPDHDAARVAMTNLRPRTRIRKAVRSK